MTATVVLAVIVAVVASTVVIARRRWLIVEVSGESMLPTLQPGQRIRVLRHPPALIRRGDIVVVEPLTRPGMTAPRTIKRVVAVTGDPVPPSCVGALRAEDPAVVPVGSVVLLGDNPEYSYDSRQFGYVPLTRISAIAAAV